jgi:hypothetical protein
MLDPAAGLLNLHACVQGGPEGQPWVEIGGERLTGLISVDGKSARGALWQDTAIQGSFHKAGESVEFPY